MDWSQDAVELDELGSFGRVGLRVEPLDWDLGEVGIGVVAGAVFVGETLGFDLYMERLSGLEAHAAEIEVFGDVQELEGGQALGVCGHAVDVDSAVVGDERVAPFGVLFAEVFDGHPSADALEVGFDRLGDGAVVVGVAAAFGDHAVGAGKIGVASYIAFVRCGAAGRVCMHRVRGLFDA